MFNRKGIRLEVAREINFKKVVPILISGMLGAIFCVYLYSEILNPQYIDWIFAQGGDPAQHYLGWNFFRNSNWTFPIGVSQNYIYPSGVPITFTDSIPLMAFLFKLFEGMMPANFQYFGIWFLICFSLQGIFGYLLAKTVSKNEAFCILASILFILSPIMIWRTGGHEALAGHWVILAALWMVLRGSKKLSTGGWMLLIGLSLLIHPYILFMIGFIMIVDVLMKCFTLKEVSLKQSAIFLGKTLVAIIVFSYIIGIFYVDSVASDGFGYYSMNVNAIVNSMGWSSLLQPMPCGEGQYEGFNYLGLGVIVLFVVSFCFFLRCDNKFQILKFWWPFLAVCAVLTLLALSNKIYFGEFLLFGWETDIAIINKVLGVFRSSGRMFWPVYYLIIVFSLAFVKKMDNRKALCVFIPLLFLQSYDLSNQFQRIDVSKENIVWQTSLVSRFWDLAAEDYDKVCFIPDYDHNTYTDIAFWASNNGLKLNSGYIARPPKNYANNLQRQVNELQTGNISHDTLYIFKDSVYPYIPYIKNLNPEDYLLADIDGYTVLAPAFKSKHPEEKEKIQPFIVALSDYLASLDKDKLILVSVRDEASSSLTDAVVDEMKRLGLNIDLRGKYRYSYIGIGGERISGSAIEQLQIEKIQMSFKKGHELGSVSLPFDLEIVSGGMYDGDVSSIKINGIEYSKNRRGMNIVVYDLEKEEVVDSVNFDTFQSTFR